MANGDAMTDTERARAQYKDFWVHENAADTRHAYYERLYAPFRGRIRVEPGARVLDVAGGDGQLLEYFGFKGADILDISESGLSLAARKGFRSVEGDVQAPFPVEAGSYDAVLLFEVLEHLHHPSITLVETYYALKPDGVLYVGQPNMRADGTHHVRRYYPQELLSDLKKAGYTVDWFDFIPAYSMRDAILSDIRNNPSWVRKSIQCVNLCLSLLPRSFRYGLAKWWPARFALMLVVRAVKPK